MKFVLLVILVVLLLVWFLSVIGVWEIAHAWVPFLTVLDLAILTAFGNMKSNV